MDAFTNVPSNGKIAMKFEGEDEDDRLIGVALLDESDDVLLATRQGKAIRFAGDDVREFQSRNSTGVRGMRLADGDAVISLSILHRVGTTMEERSEEHTSELQSLMRISYAVFSLNKQKKPTPITTHMTNI